MIKMIAGVFGLPVKQANGKCRVVAKGSEDGPFSADPEQEARLVAMGLAQYVEQPQDETFDEDGAPIGFDETPPEDFDEDGEELPELPEGVTAIPEYSVDMKATELREIGKLCGLTFKVGMTKEEMVAALDAHIEANMVEDEDFDEDGEGVADDGEPAPAFDAAEAVQ